jgi:hypothetical protein
MLHSAKSIIPKRPLYETKGTPRQNIIDAISRDRMVLIGPVYKTRGKPRQNVIDTTSRDLKVPIGPVYETKGHGNTQTKQYS